MPGNRREPDGSIGVSAALPSSVAAAPAAAASGCASRQGSHEIQSRSCSRQAGHTLRRACASGQPPASQVTWPRTPGTGVLPGGSTRSWTWSQKAGGLRSFPHEEHSRQIWLRMCRSGPAATRTTRPNRSWCDRIHSKVSDIEVLVLLIRPDRDERHRLRAGRAVGGMTERWLGRAGDCADIWLSGSTIAEQRTQLQQKRSRSGQ
jgi:hypothetical protein